MYPTPLPSWVRTHHRRRAECDVYDALQNQLQAPWRVFYSRPWLGLAADGRDREGEADFVLVHPERGMLVLEVKGGGIERDGVSGQWYTTNADGDRFRIKDPAQQARTNKHALLSWLRDQVEWNSRFICARHAVVFPDCQVPKGHLGPDLPREIVAGRDEMRRLGDWIERIMTCDPEPRVVPMGADGVRLLTGYFARSFTLPQPASSTLQCDDREIRILTDQQVAILSALEHHRRLAIPGLAGTGKTALAVAKARSLAIAGKRTALLCYNRALAAQLGRELGDVPNLVVRTYLSLCSELAKCVPGALAAEPDSPDFYSKHLPSALRIAMERRPDRKFDALIIDEGQDFDEGWFDAVECLLSDPAEGILFVFYDDNQRVHLNAAAITAHFPSSSVKLTRIVRNGRKIVQTLAPLLPVPYDAAAPEGLPVRFIETRAEITEADVTSELKRLIKDQLIDPENIAVLVPDERFRRRIVRGERIGDWPVRDAEAPPGAVVCETFRRFKGLERQVVLVCEPEAAIGDPSLLYVALTRGRVLLELLGSKGRLDQLRTLLASDKQ